MKVRTVQGDISPDDLGVALPHEHVIVDVSCCWKRPREEEKKAIAEASLSFGILGQIRREVCINKENLILDSANDAIEELLRYRKAGGNGLFDVSTEGIGRNPEALRNISTSSKTHIICSTGWYLQISHPTFVHKADERELTEIMVRELTEGIAESKIRAGVIGEIGCSKPLHPEERKVLLAATRAQERTGAPLTIHGVDKQGKILEIIENRMVPQKTYLSHTDYADLSREDLNFERRIMDKGISILYDRFGLEGFYDDSIYPGKLDVCTDTQRINAIVDLCKEGYDRNIMLSQDVCMKMQTVKYGGYGYAHILEHIVPVLKHRGLSDKQIGNMLVENPKRVLSW